MRSTATAPKPIAAKDIQPGMRVRLVNALPGTAWDTYREVAKVHNVGIWRQFQIMLTDGDWAMWSTDTMFEVEPATTAETIETAHTEALIESGRRIYAARLAAEGPRAANCEGGMWCRCPVVSPCYPPRNA